MLDRIDLYLHVFPKDFMDTWDDITGLFLKQSTKLLIDLLI